MDLVASEEQRLLRDSALLFARERMSAERARALEDRAAAGDHAHDAELAAEIAALGWLGAALPAAHGGGAVGLLELALLIEACGTAPLPTTLFGSVVEAGLLLADAGSEQQRERWLPDIAEGKAVLAVALLEEGARLGPHEVLARATPLGGGGYRLDGRKALVRDAGAADALVVAARTANAETGDADTGAAQTSDTEAGVTLLLVERGETGLVVEPQPASGGEPLFTVRLDGVEVGAEAVIGEPGAGWPPIERMLARGAALKAAELVGIGQAALDLTLAYARERVQFGRPIGSFQAVQHHCANIYRELVACRLLAYRAAWALDRAAGDPTEPAALRAVVAAKAKASEAIPWATRIAHQVHGGVGYYRDYPLEQHTRRAIAAAAAYGDARYHRRRLAQTL
jgi:alkylation response protein AidB-like acyl-CoA dehydrogenase